MKIPRLAILALAASALLCSVGCVQSPVGSTPFPAGQTGDGPPKVTVDDAAAYTKIVVSNIVLPVLANNPKYESALIAVAVGVDVAFAAKEITPEGINSFLDTVALKYELDPKTRIYIGAGLLDLLDVYHSRYGPQVATTADPRVVSMLNALRDGIKTGITRYHALSGA